MDKKAVRVGIDVGGTHTKAVAIDNATNEIIGKASVMTTHDDEKGVAAGVVQAFNNCLTENGIKPDDVIFIAHSTTQATNALLEGDVAEVGVLGIGKGGLEGFLAKRQTRIKDIDLGTGKFIKINHTYRKNSQISENGVKEAIDELLKLGSKVIVASKAFGVDSAKEEIIVKEVAEKLNIPCTVASDITKLYGLTTRTRTASINASILPKMLETADSTEESVKKAGIKVPLMMMRGDGGVMSVTEMKKRPVLTMLSGPAASVVGALMYLRASNGIYFEVGGTSTNIGVIKNGRPTVDYSIVGGHRTYINSLDVRVLGVAGGSMVRVKNGKIIDVGPRSAHIARLPYSAFTLKEEIIDPQVEFVRPKQDDPDDYVAIKLKNGKKITITNTCAANVLKLLEPNDFACGNYESCCKAMEPLAKLLGLTIEETAKQILEKSCEKIVPVLNELAEKYQVEADQTMLVGVGGGAGSLLPFTANLMNMKYKIPENAEVISSIGVALAMVREMVERVIPDPTAEDIVKIKKEAANMAIGSGAVPDSVEVYIEIDTNSQKVIATAMGSTEVKTTDLMKVCTLEEAKELAAESMNLSKDKLNVEADNGEIFVFTSEVNKSNQIRIIDKKGFIKIQRRDAVIVKCTVENLEEMLRMIWDKTNCYKGEMVVVPDVYILSGSRIFDYSGIPRFDQVKGLALSEVSTLDTDKELVLVGARNAF
ncbi:hydantoinase/oxoprolinase family protein [Clostridium sp.]